MFARRVLYIAYHFPPFGGAGAQRSVKFAKYLPHFGWHPVIVTGPSSTQDRWSPPDHSLGRELPNGMEIVRVPGTPPAASRHRARAERLLGLSSRFADWWIEGAVEAGARVDGVDVILATGSPFESLEVAARVSKALGVPWVADLRDPWALDEMMVYPTALHRGRERRHMGEVLRTAEAIIMNTNDAASVLLRTFRWARVLRVAAIPNGFDAEDFAGPPPRRPDSAFRIVHTGYLHTELGRRVRQGQLQRFLGGAVPGIDIFSRSHVFLLEAVEGIAREGAAPIEVHLAGVSTSSDRLLGEGRGFPVRMPGYLPHDQSLELVRSADLLFLPMHDLPIGRRATIVPGKTYEYLASGRPILAAVPDGDARDLLSQAAGVYVRRPTDIEGMSSAIRSIVESWRREGTPQLDRMPIVESFERRALTERLVELLDEVTGCDRAPEHAGSVSAPDRVDKGHRPRNM